MKIYVLQKVNNNFDSFKILFNFYIILIIFSLKTHYLPDIYYESGLELEYLKRIF